MKSIPVFQELPFRVAPPRPDAKVFHGTREFALELQADIEAPLDAVYVNGVRFIPAGGR